MAARWLDRDYLEDVDWLPADRIVVGWLNRRNYAMGEVLDEIVSIE